MFHCRPQHIFTPPLPFGSAALSHDQAMNAAVVNADAVLLLNAILPQALDPHPKVAHQAMICTDGCLLRLERGGVLRSSLADGLNIKALVLAMAKGAGSKLPAAKDATRRSAERQDSRTCKLLRNSSLT